MPHRIVSELNRAVTERPAFTPDELAAFRWQDKQRRLRLGEIFAGKEIVWRAFNNTKDTQAPIAAARIAAKGASRKRIGPMVEPSRSSRMNKTRRRNADRSE